MNARGCEDEHMCRASLSHGRGLALPAPFCIPAMISRSGEAGARSMFLHRVDVVGLQPGMTC